MLNDFIIISISSLVACCCSLLGCFLILRKMAMVTDAISHAVLPGIVLAFLFSQTRDTFIMVLGAGITGLIATFLIEFIHKKAKIQSDAAIGIVFTSLFAIGIILVSIYTQQVDLDQECVLYGDILHVSLDILVLSNGISLGPIAYWTLTPLLLIITFVIIFCFRALTLVTFDENFAKAIGISVVFFHYLLMSLVSFTTVASFESVGAILVIAFFIIPPSIAYLLTKNLKVMLALSCVVSIICSIGGYYLSVLLNSSTAGTIAFVAGILFFIAFLFTPYNGYITKRFINQAKK